MPFSFLELFSTFQVCHVIFSCAGPLPKFMPNGHAEATLAGPLPGQCRIDRYSLTVLAFFILFNVFSSMPKGAAQ